MHGRINIPTNSPDGFGIFPLISMVNSSATARGASFTTERGGSSPTAGVFVVSNKQERQNVRNPTYNWTESSAAGLQIGLKTGEKAQPQSCLSFLFALKTEKLGGKGLNKLRQKYSFQGTIFGLCFFPVSHYPFDRGLLTRFRFQWVSLPTFSLH